MPTRAGTCGVEIFKPSPELSHCKNSWHVWSSVWMECSTEWTSTPNCPMSSNKLNSAICILTYFRLTINLVYSCVAKTNTTDDTNTLLWHCLPDGDIPILRYCAPNITQIYFLMFTSFFTFTFLGKGMWLLYNRPLFWKIALYALLCTPLPFSKDSKYTQDNDTGFLLVFTCAFSS